MAKIVMTFDTLEKTCEITLDGEKMEDVHGCSMYLDYDDKPRVEIIKYTKLDNGLNVYTKLSASENKSENAVYAAKDKSLIYSFDKVCV